MTRDGLKNASSAQREKIAEQVRFLAGVQKDFYQSMAEFLKNDLHYGGLVVASNWTTADPAVLDPVERYTYTAGDVMDRHGYFNNPHEGEGADYSVRTGHTFKSLSPLVAPEQAPLNVLRIDGFPQIISEIGYASPNRFRAESTLLTAAYASMAGINGVFFFGLNSDFFHDSTLYRGSLSSPVTYATFPAAALLFRRADVAPAMPAYVESIAQEQFANLKAGASGAGTLDSIRKHDAPAGAAEEKGPLDPLAYYVGPVLRTYNAAHIATADLNFYINRAAKRVRTSNEAVTWEYGKGLLTVNTPLTVGVAGFLAKEGKIDVGPLSVESEDEYASIVATSLDYLPLEQSHKILVQAMTEDRPYGFKTDGDKITSLGGVPYNVRKIHAKVGLNFTLATKALAAVELDENGYAGKSVAVKDGAFVWPEDCVYVVLAR